ncbi:MAG TPA: phospholipase D-like domain-containing protein [Pyrinomonadaceae bacterium]|nr:phospholipase D-like domain-containing protein [Pyrinomonadaceae bacterium]
MSTSPPIKELEDRYLLVGPIIDRHTTMATPILDGHEYYRRIGAHITNCNGPGDVIYIVGWTFENSMHLPDVVDSLSEILHEKAASGVDVRVLLWASRWLTGTDMAESVPEILFNFGAETAAGVYVEVVQRNIRLAEELRQLGAPDFPLKGRVLLDWSGTRSHHAKYTILKAGNSIRAFIGIDYQTGYMDTPRHVGLQWHDVGFELQGGAVMSVWADFITRWKECTSLPLARFRRAGVSKFYNTPTHFPDTPIPTPEQVPTTSYSIQILRSQGPTKYFKHFMAPSQSVRWEHYPQGGVQEVLACFVKAIAAARRYIYVEDQALNDTFNKHVLLFPHIAQALNRNVKVIFVTSTQPDVIFDLPFGSPLSSDIKNMLETVEPSKRQNFVLYRVDRLTVHSKVVLIDDEFFTIGSANFFDASMSGADSELTVAVVDTGPLAVDWRVSLWKDHLRIPPDAPNLPEIEAEIRNLYKSLAIWRPGWGTGVSFPHPGPVLKLVGPE